MVQNHTKSAKNFQKPQHLHLSKLDHNFHCQKRIRTSDDDHTNIMNLIDLHICVTFYVNGQLKTSYIHTDIELT